VNFDLTRGYLDLVVTYFCIMIIVSRVEDRKAVLGLFNFAYELQNGKKSVICLSVCLSVCLSYDISLVSIWNHITHWTVKSVNQRPGGCHAGLCPAV